jgi:putative transcriptional regulator
MPSAAPEITNHIRRFRFERGEMTQDQLAQQAGVTRHTIMALEAGKYFPSLLLAFRIARALGVRIEQVFEYNAGEMGS